MSDLRSDEEIAAVRIGPPDVLNSRVTLVPYDESWPRLYEREAERLRAILGDRVVLLEHAGSTSVPGLPAKPIIDMVLVVDDSADEAAYVPALQEAGYVLRVREPDWHAHRLFKGPAADINLHVFSAGCGEVERMMRFRDHLRTSDADRELYGRSKRDLAAKTWKYTQHYADAKTAVVEEIVARAGAPPAAAVRCARDPGALTR